MEEESSTPIIDAELIGIRFGLTTNKDIQTASISGCSINHASQLTNPFLGLPLEFGKCESCGTAEPGKCDGHFGYVELPVPIYHPSHISELKQLLSLLCLNCLKLKNKGQIKTGGVAERLLSSCCEDSPQVSVKEVKTTDGACYLELRRPRSNQLQERTWGFLERYGFRYGVGSNRSLLPCEVMQMLKRIPAETRRKLSGKGYFPQDGYIIQYLPVPPNCLSVPDVSDGVSVMSSDLSISMLKKVLKKIEIIKASRSGTPNFESHEVESNDLQSAVNVYLQVRGTTKAARDARFGMQDPTDSSTSTKEWLEKMRTLFIKKSSGFSSRSVITGDPYKKVNEIGIPFEVAHKITFEERVNAHNLSYLQDLVDNKQCLTYKDGASTYSLREGSKGHTVLKPGQVVHRRIMDGDRVFINRPPTTHKHSLQALSVYIHEDHTVKINPLICGPLSADFDGDCIHLFYPQAPAAKAEVLELFSVEKQLLSSHTGLLNLQMATDSLLSLKTMCRTFFFDKAAAQQLSMFLSSLSMPALLKGGRSDPQWTWFQIIQSALPDSLNSSGDKFLIRGSEIANLNFDRDLMQSVLNDIVTSIFLEKGAKEALDFFDSLQPMLMEHLCSEGYSVSLGDFSVAKVVLENLQKDIQVISPLLSQLTKSYREPVELQIENHIRSVKGNIAKIVSKTSALGGLIDSKSESAFSKIIQQVGFLGLQLSDRGKFYSKSLFDDMATHFRRKYPADGVHYPSAEFGLIQSSFFHGLDPYEEMVHSISTREVIVRSSRGLSEPGTLFKNLMAILRDVLICYDGTVRNVSSNSVIQFEYGLKAGSNTYNEYPAGEPVGVLAATAMSNPAYKAVLDSSPSSTSSWDFMKEILLCRVAFKNDPIDRRVILHLNECHCGREFCQEKAAIKVQNQLRKVKLKDTACEFLIEYKQELVGHIHLRKDELMTKNISMEDIVLNCEESINSFLKKKKAARHVKPDFSFSECCSFEQSHADGVPCLMFFCKEGGDVHLEGTLNVLANLIYPVLLDTVIKGDPRIHSANVIWVSPDSLIGTRSPEDNPKGELALDIVLEKSAVKQSGDAWRILLDSCLPVLHLIDTRRSLPYAIKQIQELLGISCTFEQAVQRLSKSVTMVSKGILKEHLILLANSMTCAGNLVGFNSGGYKALSRSLKIQVPFTEATLFTPRKCFERAAEKCYRDSLSSVVAACSWGKNVAVGTGTRFDILWDKEKVAFNPEGGVDVYNLLSSSSPMDFQESSAAYLGGLPEKEMAEWSSSPQRNESGGWGVNKDDASNGWNAGGEPSEGGWGEKKEDASNGWNAGSEPSGSGWGEKKEDDSNGWNAGGEPSEGGWGQKKEDASKDADAWGGSRASSEGNAWNAHTAEASGKDNAWGVNKDPSQDAWNADKAESSGKSVDAWENRANPVHEGGWGAKVSAPAKSDDWENRTNPVDNGGWGEKVSEPVKSNAWENRANPVDEGRWGEKVSEPALSDAWGTPSKPANEGGWGVQVSQPAKSDAWENLSNPVDEGGWGVKASEPEKSDAWGNPSNPVDEGGWDTKITEPAKSEVWGKPSNSGDIFAGTQDSQPASKANPWVMTDADDTQNDNSPWGQPRSSRGRASQGTDWGQKKNYPPRASGPNDGGVSAMWYTVTRQRKDMFTTEEQDILADIEPLMTSIRRIMHNTGYKDGDPLSADDHTYILDNVFAHHPDRARKMGAGIDHFMISKHVNFADSRCLYVVTTDGRQEDFSYRKCLDNFIRGKYPDLADEFLGKYFKKRTGGNREQSAPPETPQDGTS